jgi:hypothetical protein
MERYQYSLMIWKFAIFVCYLVSRPKSLGVVLCASLYFIHGAADAAFYKGHQDVGEPMSIKMFAVGLESFSPTPFIWVEQNLGLGLAIDYNSTYDCNKPNHQKPWTCPTVPGAFVCLFHFKI